MQYKRHSAVPSSRFSSIPFLFYLRRHRYPTPYVSSGSTTPFWYSVDVGPTHIIMVRTRRTNSHRLVLRDYSPAHRAPLWALPRNEQCPNLSAFAGQGDAGAAVWQSKL